MNLANVVNTGSTYMGFMTLKIHLKIDGSASTVLLDEPCSKLFAVTNTENSVHLKKMKNIIKNYKN